MTGPPKVVDLSTGDLGLPSWTNAFGTPLGRDVQLLADPVLGLRLLHEALLERVDPAAAPHAPRGGRGAGPGPARPAAGRRARTAGTTSPISPGPPGRRDVGRGPRHRPPAVPAQHPHLARGRLGAPRRRQLPGPLRRRRRRLRPRARWSAARSPRATGASSASGSSATATCSWPPARCGPRSHYGVPALVVVNDNSSFYNDEPHQAEIASHRGRPEQNSWIGMRIADPAVDLAGLARSYGCWAQGPVTDPDDLAGALAARARPPPSTARSPSSTSGRPRGEVPDSPRQRPPPAACSSAGEFRDASDGAVLEAEDPTTEQVVGHVPRRHRRGRRRRRGRRPRGRPRVGRARLVPAGGAAARAGRRPARGARAARPPRHHATAAPRSPRCAPTSTAAWPSSATTPASPPRPAGSTRPGHRRLAHVHAAPALRRRRADRPLQPPAEVRGRQVRGPARGRQRRRPQARRADLAQRARAGPDRPRRCCRPGVLNVVTGVGDVVGARLVEHPDVPRVAFTGSVPTGRAVLRGAAEEIKHVSLELGGKNPVVVFPDVDVELAARAAVAGMNIARSTGQSCGSGSRLYVHDDVRGPFLEALLRRLDADGRRRPARRGHRGRARCRSAPTTSASPAGSPPPAATGPPSPTAGTGPRGLRPRLLPRPDRPHRPRRRHAGRAERGVRPRGRRARLDRRRRRGRPRQRPAARAHRQRVDPRPRRRAAHRRTPWRPATCTSTAPASARPGCRSAAGSAAAIGQENGPEELVSYTREKTVSRHAAMTQPQEPQEARRP